MQNDEKININIQLLLKTKECIQLVEFRALRRLKQRQTDDRFLFLSLFDDQIIQFYQYMPKISETRTIEEDESYVCENKSGKQPKCRKIFWTQEQNCRYACFLEENLAYLENKKRRVSPNFFWRMASAVSNRTNDQCRSHHQKMLQKFSSVSSIIVNLKKRLISVREDQKREASTSEEWPFQMKLIQFEERDQSIDLIEVEEDFYEECINKGEESLFDFSNSHLDNLI